MNNDDMQAILDLSCEDRYDYFLDMVGEEREVWILINNDEHFLKLHSDEHGGIEYLPVWPSADFATAYASDDTDLSPRSIALPQFLKKWLAGLDRDGIEVGVLPGADKSVWITEAGELEKDLREELSRF
ncbi:DUF2750 domain-containing protein [Microbulbifer flavimaris]|uniref:DUF2750 domain-containing protein n=1 Tax=Microbulbifer flavimaris TaxID=1781068 RepID=A0ABX4I1S1_9GAMM|nr:MULTISPECIES: DUF2750 domain-containing protein [Microbulbifer]KUJ84197.1 hypothetical protein AVO43_00320 [Microbulbifer sp. ZGT114]PCO06271.1 DUF2750 domain-containing protein [Microbulbifer flavimaris]